MSHLPRCGGFTSWNGPCGAPDCYRCHPEFFHGCEWCERLTYWDEGVCQSCGHGEGDDRRRIRVFMEGE